MIVHHVGEHSWDNCCWSDDNLSSKKLYPKYQFPSKSKKWLPRLQTTEESTTLMVQYMHARHTSLPAAGRRKLDLASVESIAERSACVHNLALELMLTVPINKRIVEDKFVSAWAAGSMNIDHEVQSALLDKKDDFDIRKDIPTFAVMLKEHMAQKPLPDATAEMGSTLEADKFQLLLKQAQYDQQVYETWVRKTAIAQASRDHAQHEWRLQRREACVQAAMQVLSATTKLLVWDTRSPEKSINEMMQYKRFLASKLGLAEGTTSHVVYLNYTAPSLIPAACQRAQVDMLSFALTDNMQSVGLVLNPVYTYKNGRLYKEEEQLVRLLERGNMNFDWQFSVLYSSRSDARDLRPLVMNGRLVFPSPLELTKNIYWQSSLRKRQRTDEVQQLAVKEMKTIEDINADALPPSTDARGEGHIHGAAKYHQVGPATCSAILQGVLTDTHMAGTHAILVIDLFPSTGDMLAAFLKQNRLQKTPMFFLGYCQDQNELSWLESTTAEQLAAAFQDGEVPLPNSRELPATISDDMLEVLPKQPALNILVIDKDDELRLPSTLVQQWAAHPTFGIPFTQWMDAFCQTYAVIDMQKDAGVKACLFNPPFCLVSFTCYCCNQKQLVHTSHLPGGPTWRR